MGHVSGICSSEGRKIHAPCHNEPRFLLGVLQTQEPFLQAPRYAHTPSQAPVHGLAEPWDSPP